jgi:hypothetical protein
MRQIDVPYDPDDPLYEQARDFAAAMAQGFRFWNLSPFYRYRPRLFW